jgi:phosphatidylserine/phosphatidylglycerophosphate/cardiolipin synthase-like enzyme
MVRTPRTIRHWVLSAVICGGLSAAICVPQVYARAEHKAHVEVAFTPADDVAGMIVSRIGQAKQSVRMQAYLFTDRAIANALLAARKRGVEVEVIGDAAQQLAGGLPYLKALHRAGARVWLDASLAAAHNKILIIDGDSARAAVITGSYNFTRAAQASNAENIVVISGNRAVTDRFVDNFARQRSRSDPWRSTSTSRP